MSSTVHQNHLKSFRLLRIVLFLLMMTLTDDDFDDDDDDDDDTNNDFLFARIKLILNAHWLFSQICL